MVASISLQETLDTQKIKHHVFDFFFWHKEKIWFVLIVSGLLGFFYFFWIGSENIYTLRVEKLPYEKEAIIQKIVPVEQIRFSSKMGNRVEIIQWAIYWEDFKGHTDSSIVLRSQVNVSQISLLNYLKPKDTIKVKYNNNKENLVILK